MSLPVSPDQVAGDIRECGTRIIECVSMMTGLAGISMARSHPEDEEPKPNGEPTDTGEHKTPEQIAEEISLHAHRIVSGVNVLTAELSMLRRLAQKKIEEAERRPPPPEQGND